MSGPVSQPPVPGFSRAGVRRPDSGPLPAPSSRLTEEMGGPRARAAAGAESPGESGNFTPSRATAPDANVGGRNRKPGRARCQRLNDPVIRIGDFLMTSWGAAKVRHCHLLFPESVRGRKSKNEN
ncbi:hypothetical protein chiPu_0021393 [Chiloscyllium punctatum]|uniref:Uncharacterized protein n=1 Tax=Chiloscyllium punctatum TaxID=137246 RepID=A0A401REI3_CHIPU|nr:hypothetical protein [Chiloscyllium punctatum]